MSDQMPADILGLTARIVSAHLASSPLETEALPSLIQSVYRSLSSLSTVQPASVTTAALNPAVPIKKSLFPDYIVCLEDGKKLKTLKRHLQTSYGMTPDAYRTKWGLPADYPMVSPNHRAMRSSLAKRSGLGSKPAVAAAEPAGPEVTALPARRARGSKG